MAARSDDPDVSPESSLPAAAGGEIWGTLEELLLACAVRRHGTASWDSVAVEVQSRSSPSAAARLSPNSCRLRYRLLHRRFAAGADYDGEPDAAADAWVEELRKLRVAELRREVERYDLSIGSLKSKVKRLKEERERSLSGEATPAASKEEREAGNEEAGGENRVSGEAASGPSCKESNSSDLKPPPGHDSGGGAADGKAEVKEEPAAGVVAVKKKTSGESVAGSKEADAEKDNSDVQSSASPLRQRRRRLRKVGGDLLASTSAPLALPAAETEPLRAFLESVRTSKFGSVFERRLESQESGEYRGTIRRHVDLEMIRSRLESCGAAGGPGNTRYASASEFYRDLLLLCANALVFFPRGSREHAAAARTRALVSKRISASLLHRGGIGTSGKDAAVPVVGGGSSADGAKKPKDDAEIAGSLLEKAAPIIVCRKRSSIAKAAAAAAGKDEKAEKVDTDEEEDDEGKKKGDAKDKARELRTNKRRGPVKNSAPNQKTGKASEGALAAAEGIKKSDKKGGSGGKAPAATGGVIKKRNAVDFLKRIKQNSTPPSTERVSLLETLKLSAATEQKKAGKGDGRKEPGSSSGSKKAAAAAADTGSGGRRGRPPKRATAPSTPPPAKRAKDDRPTRKRGKK